MLPTRCPLEPKHLLEHSSVTCPAVCNEHLFSFRVQSLIHYQPELMCMEGYERVQPLLKFEISH